MIKFPNNFNENSVKGKMIIEICSRLEQHFEIIEITRNYKIVLRYPFKDKSLRNTNAEREYIFSIVINNTNNLHTIQFGANHFYLEFSNLTNPEFYNIV